MIKQLALLSGAIFAIAPLVGCLADDDIGASSAALDRATRPGSGGGFGGGGEFLPPDTDPNAFGRPLIHTVWRTDTSVKIRWYDKSEDETGFRIERRPPNGAWTVIDTPAARAGSYLIEDYVAAGLARGTDYCFRVVAHRQRDGAQAFSHQVCTRTPSISSCDAGTLDTLLELAHDDAKEMWLTCNVHLEPNVTVTKRIVLAGSEASGVTIDLNGAILNGAPGTYNAGRDMIEVRSKEIIRRDDSPAISTYTRPENITVKNGTVRGSVRIWGMAMNGEGDGIKDWVISSTWPPTMVYAEVEHTNQYRKSSETDVHTQRAQDNAPTRIVFDNLTIRGSTRVPVYFSPGVTHSQLINSEVHGQSNAAAIYLDAESSNNLLKGNYIHAATAGHIGNTWDRPQINVDGSANNKIINNVFSSLHHGGIYLYRNCGENGVPRHQTPSHNQIINNRFIYVDYGPSFGLFGDSVNPAIYVASRDRGVLAATFTFCGLDNHLPYGSGISDRDFARHNVVMQNQIYVNSVADMIDVGNPSLNSPNYIDYNESVTPDSVELRAAGCYIAGEAVDFIRHGERYDTADLRYSCIDGTLLARPLVPFKQVGVQSR